MKRVRGRNSRSICPPRWRPPRPPVGLLDDIYQWSPPNLETVLMRPKNCLLITRIWIGRTKRVGVVSAFDCPGFLHSPGVMLRVRNSYSWDVRKSPALRCIRRLISMFQWALMEIIVMTGICVRWRSVISVVRQ